MLYPQNGDRIVTIDTVASLHPIYTVSVEKHSTPNIYWRVRISKYSSTRLLYLREST